MSCYVELWISLVFLVKFNRYRLVWIIQIVHFAADLNFKQKTMDIDIKENNLYIYYFEISP